MEEFPMNTSNPFVPNPDVPRLTKSVGRSQFKDGVRINKSHHELFNPPGEPGSTIRGDSRPILILFNSKIFPARYVFENPSDPSRIQQRIQFTALLTSEFQRLFPSLTGEFTIVTGEDINHFIFDIITSYSSSLDDEDTEELGGLYPEGFPSYRLHKVIERNPQVIAEAKATFLRKHKRLYCEVCNFSFEQKYGARGSNFIEGHHTKLVSAMKEGDATSASDIALLCSNCHRMIHRSPLLTVEALRQSLTTN